MLAHCAQALRGAVVLAVDNVHDSKWQKALGRLLKSGIEDLVHLLLEHEARDEGGSDPEQCEQQAEGDRKPRLQAQRRPHGAPSR